MRDPNRLYGFYDELRMLHIKTCPDLRFGQLFDNLKCWMAGFGVDIFFVEENHFIYYMKTFLQEPIDKSEYCDKTVYIITEDGIEPYASKQDWDSNDTLMCTATKFDSNNESVYVTPNDLGKSVFLTYGLARNKHQIDTREAVNYG